MRVNVLLGLEIQKENTQENRDYVEELLTKTNVWYKIEKNINFVGLWKSFKYYDINRIINVTYNNKDLLDDNYNTNIQKLKNEIKSINIILSYGGRIINEIW